MANAAVDFSEVSFWRDHVERLEVEVELLAIQNLRLKEVLGQERHRLMQQIKRLELSRARRANG